MGIDESGKNGCLSEVTDFATIRRNLIGRENGLNPLSLYQYGRRSNSFGSDYPTGKEGLQTQNGNSFGDSRWSRAYIDPSAPLMHAPPESRQHFTKF
jgi:hypothetical protein